MTPKERYFQKVYENALEVECACGCGEIIKNKDRYGRDKKFSSGHNARRFEDPRQFKRNWNHRNRNKRYLYKRQYHYARKRKLMALFNNECADCKIKYDGKNGCIFNFHHLDPDLKSFNIGNKLTNYAFSELLKETAKCVLICANCHKKRHSSEF